MSEHSGNVAEAFGKFLRLYKCKYAAWNRTPPADLTDAARWKGRDMLRQMRGHYSTDRFMDDIDAVATEAQIDTMSFTQLVELLHTRYKPSRNQTMSHLSFTVCGNQLIKHLTVL